MADPVVETLMNLAQSFTVSSTAGPGAHRFALRLLSPAGDSGRIEIIENVTETVIKAADIDLSALLKDVRFETPPIADGTPIGGQPILSLLTPGITQDPPTVSNKPGVAGIIAALRGTIPIAVPESVAKPLSLTFDVRWTVLDGNGNPAGDVSWTLGTAQGQGGNIPFQPAQALEPLTITFLPDIVELAADVPLTSKRVVRASVRVTARDGNGVFRATTGWIELPPVDIVLPVIPVPTLAIFFAGTFGNDALIAVPANSPLEQGTFMPALDQLNAVLNTLDTALGIGGFFISSLGDIKHALANNVARVLFRKADAQGNLNDVEFKGWTLFDWDGDDANDRISSIMMIGPPNRRIECFNDTGFQTGEGQMNLVLDRNLHVVVGNLVMASKSDIPPSDPPGLVAVPHRPGGRNGIWPFGHEVVQFDDEFSGYRFSWA